MGEIDGLLIVERIDSIWACIARFGNGVEYEGIVADAAGDDDDDDENGLCGAVVVTVVVTVVVLKARGAGAPAPGKLNAGEVTVEATAGVEGPAGVATPAPPPKENPGVADAGAALAGAGAATGVAPKEKPGVVDAGDAADGAAGAPPKLKPTIDYYFE